MARPKGKLLALVAVFAAIAVAAGTGAFTTVTAERTADVGVAGDSSALLAIEAASGSNGDYITTDNGEAQLQLSGPTDAPSGVGVNPNATTAVDNVFTITNQGTQGVHVAIERDAPNSANPGAIEFGVKTSNLEANATGPAPSSELAIRGGKDVTTVTADGINSNSNLVYLPAGESITIGFYVDTTDSNPFTPPSASGTELDNDDTMIETVTIVASTSKSDFSVNTTSVTVYKPA